MPGPPTSAPYTSDLPGIAADIFARLRTRRPRVHCITNSVAQNFTANVLLAVGAVPSMTVAPDEIAQFVARADALLVNLGTLSEDRKMAAEIAIARAQDEGRPWVLDPVFVDRSAPRTVLAKALVAKKPWAIRLNGAEFAALADAAPEDAALKRYVLKHQGVIALTGATDVVTDGARFAKLGNGDPLMAQVTAMGCAGAAVVTACLAVEEDAWLATIAGLSAFAIAGECAAERSQGPGSFAVAFIDALAGAERDTLRTRARIT